MKKMRFVFTLLAAGMLALVVCQGALADNGKPIARVLGLDGSYDEFTFKSSGNQILFAEIKSEIYQSQGRKGGSHETPDGTDGGCSDGGSPSEIPGGTTGGTTGGCTDSSHTDDTHDDSCGGGGGASDLCLQVPNPDGGNKPLCWAGRPERPGWQRDPRLACHIEGKGEFTLRVFRGQCGNPAMNAVTIDPGTEVAYLLNVQLLDMAQTGDLKDAMAQSNGE